MLPYPQQRAHTHTHNTHTHNNTHTHAHTRTHTPHHTPRAATMRLTAELLSQAEPHVNPIQEWELQLRGCTIPTIENTGTTKVRRGGVGG